MWPDVPHSPSDIILPPIESNLAVPHQYIHMRTGIIASVFSAVQHFLQKVPGKDN